MNQLYSKKHTEKESRLVLRSTMYDARQRERAVPTTVPPPRPHQHRTSRTAARAGGARSWSWWWRRRLGSRGPPPSPCAARPPATDTHNQGQHTRQITWYRIATRDVRRLFEYLHNVIVGVPQLHCNGLFELPALRRSLARGLPVQMRWVGKNGERRFAHKNTCRYEGRAASVNPPCRQNTCKTTPPVAPTPR